MCECCSAVWAAVCRFGSSISLRKMASMHVGRGVEGGKQQQLSPHNLRRTFSSNSSSSCSQQGPGSPPKCVCAPATHAGSFKCRLHRVNSDGHSSSALVPQQPPVSNSSTPRR